MTAVLGEFRPITSYWDESVSPTAVGPTPVISPEPLRKMIRQTCIRLRQKRYSVSLRLEKAQKPNSYPRKRHTRDI